MLRLAQKTPAATSLKRLAALQAGVDAMPDFAARAAEGKRLWDSKTSSAAGKTAFADIRDTLASMCIGPVRCHYCEDSAADEIEHIRPKSLFPRLVFAWENYLFACGPCNGPKGNRYAFVREGAVVPLIAQPGAPPEPPPDLPDALIDPRREDPLDFIEIDLGGISPSGLELEGSFLFVPLPTLSTTDGARADHTIAVLGLNRQILLDARRNAFSGFRARLREYLGSKRAGVSVEHLKVMQRAILGTPHLSVLAEMLRQAEFLPFMQSILAEAPEIAGWPLVPA